MRQSNKGIYLVRGVIYLVLIFLSLLSIYPFLIMFINSTRSTPQIQASSISLVPSTYFNQNLSILEGKSFDPWVGFKNSFIVSASSTALTIYFSALTAYALVAYNWKLRKPFFTMILAVMMIPAQLTSIGFYQFMYRIGMTNNLLALILPAIAAPQAVFFIRQYMILALPIDVVESSRIDGASEFYTFNKIVLPIIVPILATQAIFSFVGSWNNLFQPLILLTNSSKYTLPIMVSLLRGDIYKTEYGAVYLGLSLTVLPIFVIYFLLARYIVEGIALGSVKG